MQKVLLFNPRSANYKPRIPNSILNIAASIEGKFDYAIVDGNLEDDPWVKIERYLASGEFGYFGCTCMPGPQLKQAIAVSKKLKAQFPAVNVIWGGYFPSNHPKVVLFSGYIDFVVNGPGDKTFPALVQALENNELYENIPNLIYKKDDAIIKTRKDELYDQDSLPPLPYDKLNSFYSLKKYLGKTYLGTKTIAYHSSVGCPFTCSFCAVVPIYNARWKGKSAQKIYSDIKYLKENFGGNAIEFHDNNFFVSEKRTAEFSKLIMHENMVWWGEGRIDTINKYSDETLALMRRSGCKMIFFGAETGNDEVLKKMDKGGTQSAAQIRAFAARMARFDIIPEYSFVLGTPAETPEKVMQQIDQDIAFIKEIKAINPATEIIIYVYSPVPTEGSDMYKNVLQTGFHFPENLEDWIGPQWDAFDLRKNPLTPWLTPEMIDKIKDFETVLNGYYPTVSDVRLTRVKRTIMRTVASLRYKSGLYKKPYELKAMQVFWKYRQPEIEGF
ncbi:B12-binding domain-containing radical SAM protein [Flavisolibacter ginsenosidimutans]|uniref:B12-binding domain-containing radical SAM protein n=1 Tax=Flavisolibacter ginsenosidimutans TaxID=661481 RepID=A0A5B8UJ11_9BACT|nr:radical SAM protein [Flavisolibacter ginsenosidimutans]QEC56657.1 B12-binding domain-containing radical SAM protein [Flavisolibacter ginsenosidimutans]